MILHIFVIHEVKLDYAMLDLMQHDRVLLIDLVHDFRPIDKHEWTFLLRGKLHFYQFFHHFKLFVEPLQINFLTLLTSQILAGGLNKNSQIFLVYMHLFRKFRDRQSIVK